MALSERYPNVREDGVTDAPAHDWVRETREFLLLAVRVCFDNPRKNTDSFSRTMTTQGTKKGNDISSARHPPYDENFNCEKLKKANGYKAPLPEKVPEDEQKNTGNYVIASVP